MTTSSRFIAFFGATGGCANATLVHTLNAGFHASALARTPSKLTNMLLAQGIPQATLDTHLTIIQGDIVDVAAIKRVLLKTNNDNNTPALLASHIVSGIGGTPQLQWSLKTPVTIDNPKVCETASTNIVKALQEIYAEHTTLITAQENKPSIVAISTTGLSDVCEDVPFGYRTLYHVLLADPHKDKKKMERIIFENAPNTKTDSVETTSQDTKVFRGAIAVRPTLLMGDQNVKGGKGTEKLKVGFEEKPAMGYSIHRADVGQWVFEETIQGNVEKYFGQSVTLTN
ncbi:hypothetical protein BGZ94_008204 [Podila epigama]|nr:hypothetical protein BGZ94_008204 [Podila epigama]